MDAKKPRVVVDNTEARNDPGDTRYKGPGTLDRFREDMKTRRAQRENLIKPAPLGQKMQTRPKNGNSPKHIYLGTAPTSEQLQRSAPKPSNNVPNIFKNATACDESSLEETKPAPTADITPKKPEKKRGFLSRLFHHAAAAFSATTKNALKTTTTALGGGYATLDERHEARQKILSAFTDVGIGALSAKVGGLAAGALLGASAMPALGLMAGTALATGVVRLGLECARDYHLKPQIGWRGLLKKNFKRAALGAGFGLIGAGLVEALDHVREMVGAGAIPLEPPPRQEVSGPIIFPMDSPIQPSAVIDAPVTPEPAAPAAPAHKTIRPIWVDVQTPPVAPVTDLTPTPEVSPATPEVAAPVTEIPTEPPVVEAAPAPVAEPAPIIESAEPAAAEMPMESNAPIESALPDIQGTLEPAAPEKLEVPTIQPLSPEIPEITAPIEPEATTPVVIEPLADSGSGETGSQTDHITETDEQTIALENCQAIERLDDGGYLLACDKGALPKNGNMLIGMMTPSM